MKRQSLKKVLPAFVFVLAIVASFAFKPAPNDVFNDVFIQRVNPTECDQIFTSLLTHCSINNWGQQCTYYELGIYHPAYSRAWGLLCLDELREPL
ncbi:DUF6520 family protein [Flavivirga amylovorans]|uniref:DUF6520 family protein n=1 Tax=Flavivirga amylovorans TaxID=870486 RepID=A0ABT8WXW7_9FLAO|nr:DUF6520 family protein [Flavivirga amylovorans]MDO5986535.1 DUF6520 family protein [Flavivirga amylovorans]